MLLSHPLRVFRLLNVSVVHDRLVRGHGRLGKRDWSRSWWLSRTLRGVLPGSRRALDCNVALDDAAQQHNLRDHQLCVLDQHLIRIRHLADTGKALADVLSHRYSLLANTVYPVG